MSVEIVEDLKQVVEILVHWGTKPPREDDFIALMQYADEQKNKAEALGASDHDVNTYQALMFLIFAFNTPPNGIGTVYELLRNIIGTQFQAMEDFN